MLEYIRDLSNNKSLDLLFFMDSQTLIVNSDKYFSNVSFSNIIKLIRIIRNERLRFRKIDIKY